MSTISSWGNKKQLDLEHDIKKWAYPGGLNGKESACNAGDLGLIPGLGRSTGEGNGYSFQCFCLENSLDRGAWWATVHVVIKSQTRLSN